MLKKVFFFSLGLSLASAGWSQSQHYLDYIDKYKDIAIVEMERSGIPASIKLAQGILESDAGRSDLARRANNHFGIKCGNNWDGRTLWKKDDDYDDRGRLQESCFRSYRDVEASFRAHSEFLLDPAKQWRYGFLFQLDATDYRRWAQGLKRAGYATSASYDTKLINLIETYELYRYDKMVINDVLIADRPTAPIEGAVLVNNDVKYVLALEGEMVSTIADRNGVSASSILKYNDHLHAENQKLAEGTYVYLQPLRNSYRGKDTWHVVQPNERMIDIALAYGVELDKLYRRNDMTYGTEAAAGEKIKLKGGKVSGGPKLRPRNINTIEEKPVVEEPVLITEKDDSPYQPERPTAVPVSQPADQKPDLAIPGWKPFEIKEKEEEEYITFEDWGEEDSFREPIFKPGIESKPEPVPPVIDRPGTPVPVSNPTNPVNPGAQYHEVQKGDTLWNISRRYGTTVDSIKQLNGLSGNDIKIGQRLRVS